MEVKFDLTNDDYWKFNKYAMFSKQPFKRTMIINLILFPIIIFAASVVIVPKIFTDISFIIILIVAIVYSVLADFLFIYFLKRRVIKMIKNNEVGTLGKHIIKIDKNGMSETSPVNEGSMSWGMIFSIDQSDEYIFIFLNALSGFVVPKRAFDTDVETEEFYNKAVEYWNAARNVNA